jgi:hypothetical protein
MVGIRDIGLGLCEDGSHFRRQWSRLATLTINAHCGYVAFGKQRPIEDAQHLKLHAYSFFAFESGTEPNENGVFSWDGFYKSGERLDPGHQNVEFPVELNSFGAAGSEELGFSVLCESKEMGEEDLSGGVGIVPVGLQSSLKHLISPQREWSGAILLPSL